jgi:sugar phosphate isomerase/epimerase
LATKIGLVHLCDATFDQRGTLLNYKALGEGDAQIARQIELLRGLLYDRYLVYEWPGPSAGPLRAPKEALESAAKFMRERIEDQQSVLSAYKADKQAPKFAPRAAAPAAG